MDNENDSLDPDIADVPDLVRAMDVTGIGDVEPQGDGPQAVSVVVRPGGASTPGNRPGPKTGWKYDERRIGELGLSLQAYFANPDNLFFESWAAAEGLSLRQCRRFLDHPGFRDVWEHCEAIQCSRLLELSSRAVKDARGSTYFRINPRVSILILQSKYAYTTKEEVTLRTEVSDRYTQIEAARRTLEQTMPKSLPEAREWLGKIRAGDDAVTAEAAEQILVRLEIEYDLVPTAGSAICDS